MEKKKILLLITKAGLGGAQRYIYDLATNLPPDQFEVVVAYGSNGALVAKLAAHNIRTTEIPGLQRDLSLWKELRAAWHIAHLIRDEDPDVLHVNSSKAGGIGAFLGRLLSVPKVVYTSHGWAFNEDRNLLARGLFGFLHWLTIMFAHQTIVVSEALKEQMRWPFSQRKMTVIYLGQANYPYLPRAEARAKLSAECPDLHNFISDTWTGTVAELHPTKQHQLVIEAIATVVAAGHTVRHLIIGDGQERDTLKKLITQHELTDHVFLLGAIEEAAQYLKALDIFILGSRSEAFGYVVLEAAAAQMPIVASEVGGIPEIVTHRESALLFKASNSSTCADAIKTYVESPHLAQQHAKAARVRSKTFSIAAMIEQTMILYSLNSLWKS